MPATTAAPRKGLNIALWVVQVLLALGYLMAGTGKATQPLDQLAKQMHWVTSIPPGLVRFIGVAELAGALGLLLPSLTRIMPILTPIAASGLVIIMALAIPVHISIGEFNMVPVPLVMGALAAFVAWGRFRAVPIAPRNQLKPAAAS